MNIASIKILGNIDKILKVKEDGSSVVLFKIAQPEKIGLSDFIVMAEVNKIQWLSLKDVSEKTKETISIDGNFEIRLKSGKPFIYLKAQVFERVNHKQVETRKSKFIKKSDKNEAWFSLIPEDQFKEIDLNKVNLVDKIHLNSMIQNFNIKKYRKYKELSPIAVKETENGTYELITGFRSFIAGKLLSRNIKAYVTNLTRAEFKEKYSLEK